MKVAAFDIETYKPVPEGEDWLDHRPLGISNIAMTLRDGSDRIRQYVWFDHPDAEEGIEVEYNNFPDPESSAKLSDLGVWSFVMMAHNLQRMDFIVTSWNGAGFDWRVIADHVPPNQGNVPLIRKVCAEHVDMMFHFFCIAGYPLGLDTAAKGMGLPGKTEGMHGDLAPVMWQGTTADRRKVLEYVLQDTKATLDVFEAIVQAKGIKWTSRSNRSMRKDIPYWLTVSEANRLTPPDNSWMTNPLTRDRFVGWLYGQ